MKKNIYHFNILVDFKFSETNNYEKILKVMYSEDFVD